MIVLLLSLSVLVTPAPTDDGPKLEDLTRVLMEQCHGILAARASKNQWKLEQRLAEYDEFLEVLRQSWVGRTVDAEMNVESATKEDGVFLSGMPSDQIGFAYVVVGRPASMDRELYVLSPSPLLPELAEKRSFAWVDVPQVISAKDAAELTPNSMLRIRFVVEDIRKVDVGKEVRVRSQAGLIHYEDLPVVSDEIDRMNLHLSGTRTVVFGKFVGSERSGLDLVDASRIARRELRARMKSIRAWATSAMSIRKGASTSTGNAFDDVVREMTSQWMSDSDGAPDAELLRQLASAGAFDLQDWLASTVTTFNELAGSRRWGPVDWMQNSWHATDDYGLGVMDRVLWTLPESGILETLGKLPYNPALRSNNFGVGAEKKGRGTTPLHLAAACADTAVLEAYLVRVVRIREAIAALRFVEENHVDYGPWELVRKRQEAASLWTKTTWPSDEDIEVSWSDLGDSEGLTPLDYALIFGQRSNAELLREKGMTAKLDFERALAIGLELGPFRRFEGQ